MHHQVLRRILVNGRLDRDVVHGILLGVHIPGNLRDRQVRPALGRHHRQRYDLPGRLD